MTKSEMREIAADTIASLPQSFRDKLDNLVVTVEDNPDSAQVRRFGRGLLGLYEGIPLSERGSSYSGAMPDKITIFRKNIEDCCETDEEIRAQVKHTVLHELAHHFGIDDERLLETGDY